MHACGLAKDMSCVICISHIDIYIPMYAPMLSKSHLLVDHMSQCKILHIFYNIYRYSDSDTHACSESPSRTVRFDVSRQLQSIKRVMCKPSVLITVQVAWIRRCAAVGKPLYTGLPGQG